MCKRDSAAYNMLAWSWKLTIDFTCSYLKLIEYLLVIDNVFIVLLCSLIKMLYWMCERSNGQPLSGPQLEHAIKRNFGGLESKTFNPVEIFKAAIDFNDTKHWPDFSTISEEVCQIG